jgi:hypothetical protein
MAKSGMHRRWFQRARPATIQSRIRWLVIACIVPSWLLAAAVTYLSYARERDALASTTVQTAELLMQAVDRELSTNIAVLQTLATSSRIDDRDFARFHERAVHVMRQASADNIVLFDPQLRGLANAARPFGPVVPAQPQDRFPNVMPTGQPGVSDLFVGQVSKTAQPFRCCATAPPSAGSKWCLRRSASSPCSTSSAFPQAGRRSFSTAWGWLLRASRIPMAWWANRHQTRCWAS